MKQIFIDLPPDETIESWFLTLLIAKAICPTLENAIGIDCVIGKLLPHPGIEEFCEFPYAITDEDRSKLEPLLIDLPPLHGKMYDLEIATFLYLYETLPNRLPWTPIINDEAHILKTKYEQEKIQDIHREKLQQRLQGCRIQAFDLLHCPAKHIGPNVFIPRMQAIEYLNECGIKIRQNVYHLNNSDSIASTSNSMSELAFCTPQQISIHYPNEGGVPHAVPINLVSKVTSHKGTSEPWTLAELDELEKFFESQKKQFRNYTELTAKKYGISSTRIRELLAEKRVRSQTSPFAGLMKS